MCEKVNFNVIEKNKYENIDDITKSSSTLNGQTKLEKLKNSNLLNEDEKTTLNESSTVNTGDNSNIAILCGLLLTSSFSILFLKRKEKIKY